MENGDQENKKTGKQQHEASPYQELYGKKEKDGPEADGKRKLLKDAGAFGSAAKKPGPESRDSAIGRRQSEDGSDRDGQED